VALNGCVAPARTFAELGDTETLTPDADGEFEVPEPE
jgi:hypothetical protein